MWSSWAADRPASAPRFPSAGPVGRSWSGPGAPTEQDCASHAWHAGARRAPASGTAREGAERVAAYGVRIVADDAVSARAGEEDVEVTTASGVIRARHLIVATGLTDELPEIPSLTEQWGTGAVVCPYCDGWEHRHHVIGVVATSPQSVAQAQLLRQWSDRVIYFPNVAGEPDDPGAEALAIAASGWKGVPSRNW